jgi:signal transduction histidine kinase
LRAGRGSWYFRLVQSIAVPALPTRRQLWIYLIPVTVLVATLALSVACLLEAFGEAGQTFPGFFTYSNGSVAPLMRRHFSGVRAGVQVRDEVVALDGRPVKGGHALRAALRGRTPGTPVAVTLRRPGGGPAHTITVAAARLTTSDVALVFILPFAIGVVYLLLGSVVLFTKRTRAAALMFSLCVVAASFYVTMFDAHTAYRFARVWVCYPLLGAVSVHLFCLFPEEHPGWHRARVLAVPYAIAGGLCALRIGWLQSALVLDRSAVWSSVYLSLTFAADLGILIYTWRHTADDDTRKKAKTVTIGLIATVLIAVIWSFASRSQPSLLSAERVMIASAAFPALIGYAILKRNIFDIDALLRVGVGSGVATVAVVAIYLSVVAVMGMIAGPLAGRVLPGSHATLAVFVTLVAAVLFHPLRIRVQRVALRLFYRETVSLEQALMKLVRDLPGAPTLADAGDRLVSNIVRQLNARGACLLFTEPRSGRFVVASAAGELPEGAREVWLPADGPLARELTITSQPRRCADLLDDLDVAREAAAALAALGAELAVPLIAHGRLVGLLTLTRRRDGTDFRADDLSVLAGAAPTAALAVESVALLAERTAQERLAALGSVAAVLIHEIKNPLGIIKVSAGALRHKFAADESGAELSRCIEEEVDRMNASIRQFLDFARPRPPVFAACDLRGVCEKLIARARPELGQRGLALRLVAEGDGPLVVRADADQVEQVLLNLLINAREATAEGGEIVVSLRPVHRLIGGRAVEVAVKDSGCGMDAEIQRKLFQPFFTTRRGGTGLGLAIVKQILDDHHGQIRVESTSGQGSRFVFTLPAA